MARWDDLVVAVTRPAGVRLEDPAVASLVETLLGTLEEQLLLLQRLQRDAHPLREGPFHSGRAHLEAALETRRAREERLALLHAARASFTDALSLEQDKVRASLVTLHLGCCELLLGAEKQAREWLQLAHRTAVEAMKDLLSEATRDKGLTRNRFLDPALVFLMFFTSAATLGAGYLFWDRVISQRTDKVLRRALTQLESLAHYVDTVGQLRLRLGEPAPLVPRYELSHALDEGQYLSRITIRKLISDREAMYFNGRETRKVTWNDTERSEVITRELL